jgi:hypothetical protein
MANAAHNAETFLTAIGAVSRSDWNRDPRGFIRAQQQLFAAVCAHGGLALADSMTDEEMAEYAAERANELMAVQS